MQATIKTLVVALESLGFQCQYVDGSLIATNGGRNMSFVEDSQGEAIGMIPDDLRQALQQITEQQVEKRFSQQMLTELGYGEFSPSAAKPTGVGDTNAKALGIKSGEQAVTGEQPQKGPKKPQDSSDLPGDYTGDSENNQPANVPSTGGDSEASKVGPHGAAKTGSPGPNLQGPEKTQGMKVGQSLMQPDAPEADKGDYEGTQVGTIGNVQGDGKDAGGAPSMGKAPAPFPTTQGAQTLAKIPSPGAGKMTVTKATVESVLDDINRTKPIDEFFYFSDQPEGEWPEYEEGYVEAVDQAAQSLLGQSLEELGTEEEILRQSHEQKMSPEAVVQQLAAEAGLEIQDQGLAGGEAGGVEEAVAQVGRAIGKGIGKAAEFGAEVAKGAAKGVGKLAGTAVKGAGRIAGAASKGIEAAGGDLAGDEQDEALINRVIESLPKSFGLMAEIHPGPYISRETLKVIDLERVEEQLTPVLARLILEQPFPPEDEEEEEDEEGAPPPPPPPGEEEEPGGELGDMPPEPGDDEAGMGGPEEPLPGEGEPPEGDAGPEAGAPVDVDIGGAPTPQPVGGEQGEIDIEAGAPEPQIPSDEMSRYQKAKQMCPDCDDREVEELIQVGIVGDLYQALVQQVMAQKAAMAPQAEPLVASQVTTKSSDGSGDQITVFERERRLQQAWKDDPHAFVDTLIDAMTGDPKKVAKAASMVLGIDEADFLKQDAQEARNILQGLSESVRGVRNQLQDIRLSSVGKIQALVGSQFARGAFAAEAQQMMDHLIKLENGLNAFLSSLDRYESEFDQRYQGMVPTEEPGAEEAPPPPEAGGEPEAPPPPPEAPGTMAPPGGEPEPETELEPVGA